MTLRKSVAELIEFFRYHPVQPFTMVPYDAVRGITWTIMDGDGHHIATVFEEDAARLITARLNA
jgi:hypothetical protein